MHDKKNWFLSVLYFFLFLLLLLGLRAHIQSEITGFRPPWKKRQKKIEMTKNFEEKTNRKKNCCSLSCFGPDAWVGPYSVETHENFTADSVSVSEWVKEWVRERTHNWRGSRQSGQRPCARQSTGIHKRFWWGICELTPSVKRTQQRRTRTTLPLSANPSPGAHPIGKNWFPISTQKEDMWRWQEKTAKKKRHTCTIQTGHTTRWTTNIHEKVYQT